MTDWIRANDAAERLGIKPASLYSYVSRGLLTRRTAPDGRTSLFRAAEIEALARRGRPRRRGGAAELVIETGLTEIADGSLRYRGYDVIGLAAEQSFEAVAALLWTGVIGSDAASLPWRATDEAVAAGVAAQAGLPAPTLPLERLAVIVPAMAATDPLRLQLDPPAVQAAARALIAGMVECLQPFSAPPDGDRTDASTGRERAGGERTDAGAGGERTDGIAARLAGRLSPGPLSPELTDAIRAALVLVADHELAASTLAARVAASVRADPYAVVAAGLGALGGWLHGGASLGAEVMLAAADQPSDAPRVVGDLLRRGERIPGFGHFVYVTGDPRAVLLLDFVRRAAPDSQRLAVADAVLAEARRRALPQPNIDFALAVLCSVAGLTAGSGEAIFAVARTAGWLAHALEEYARDRPIRPRGIYTGPAAVSPAGAG